MPKTTKSVDYDDETLAKIEELMREKDLPSFKAGQEFINKSFLEGKTVSDDSIPENCKSCPKCGFIIKNGKMLCITKKAETDPIRYDWIPLEMLTVCAEKPFNTPINKKTREQCKRDLFNMEQMKIHHQERADQLRPKAERLPIVEKELTETTRELEEARKGKEDLLSAKSTFELKVSDMKNSLLARDEKIAVLETDNQQLRSEAERLQESKLLAENDSLRQRLEEFQLSLNQYAKEIEKLDALNDKTDAKLKDVISQMARRLKQFKENLPIGSNPDEMNLYILTLKKAIDESQGYLITVSI